MIKYEVQGGGNKWKEKMHGRESNLNQVCPSDGFNGSYDTEEFKSIQTNFQASEFAEGSKKMMPEPSTTKAIKLQQH